jgi:hypothetical protein
MSRGVVVDPVVEVVVVDSIVVVVVLLEPVSAV